MAFFATIDRLPLARTQWGDSGNPGPSPPNPPVQPPNPPVPPASPTEHHCTDGHTRVLMTKNGRGYWTCVMDNIPQMYLDLMGANQQMTGQADTSNIPSAVIDDQVPFEEEKTPYEETIAKSLIDENVEGN